MPRQILIYTSVLIIFFSCQSTELLTVQHPTVPDEPVMLKVHFEQDADGNLLLSPDEYRNLEKNIIRLRSYIDQLHSIINYYTQTIGDHHD